MSRAVEDLEQRALSRALFGQDARLGTAIAIARSSDGLVNMTDLVEETGFALSRVNDALKSMRRTGLLVKAPDMGTRKLWLQRQPSAFWAWVLELANAPVPAGVVIDL